VHNVQKRRSRQVILSTHSPDLLSDEGIDLAEILLVRPGKDGSEVMVADDIENAQDLLESGASPADVVMPLTQPRELHQGLLPYTP
jgi:hypothetical protein